MTLVFAVPAEVGRAPLAGHVRSVASRTEPFRIKLKGLEKSWDHWLLLVLEEGRAETIALHDALYTGPLSAYLRDDIEFVPHVSLVFFGLSEGYDPLHPTEPELDRRGYQKALREAERLRLEYVVTLSELILTGFDRELRGVSADEFSLGSP
jgi:hypothetical protein